MSKKKEALPIVSQTQEMVSADHADIRNMIHLIRGQQVSGMSFLWLFKGFPFNSSGTCSRGL